MTRADSTAPDRTQVSLTDRYVHAATRRLPDDQRDDVALELRASIEDRVEARLDADPALARADAEHQALVELGDPDRLSAGYAGAPQHLVGPELYPTYVRTLRMLLLSIVPVVTVVVGVVGAFEEESFGPVIGQTIWTGMTVAVQVCFWTTVGFVIAERASDPGKVTESLGLTEWSPEQLPHLPKGPRASLGEAVANVVWLAILGGLLVWQQVMPFVRDGDERLPVVDPDLWTFWMPLVLATLALEACFEVVKYRAGGTWTVRFAAVNTVTGALFAAPIAWLAYTEQLLNPAFVAHVQEGWTEFDPGVAHTLVLLSAVVIWAWDSIDGWLKALRQLG